MKIEKLKNYLILDLTKNEKDLLNDLFIYMVDYIHDPCFTNKDRKTFDPVSYTHLTLPTILRV